MRLDIYVNYPGCCEAAFEFYEAQLGGRITAMVRHGERRQASMPADWADKVMHARVTVGDTVLMGADIPNAELMRSAYLTLQPDTAEETERIYGVLVEGGQVFMPIAQTPFANRFAMLRDRFGTSWMLLHEPRAG